jgi:cell division protein FtsI (penicillin-binding protein 3)
MTPSPRRLGLCLCLVLLALGGLVARAAWLRVHDGDRLARLAARQSSRDIEVAARRGAIYDRGGVSLALSVAVESIYARPGRVAGRDIARLAAALGQSPAELAGRLERRRPFVWVERQVSPATAARVRALGIDGVGFATEYKRYYPNGALAGHVLGFAGVDGQGLEGVERAYDPLLRGDAARRAEGRDARGRQLLEGGLDPDESAPEGAALVLTLDRRLQFAAEEALRDAVAAAGAAGGTAIALDPATGDLLALANAPAFDPNRFAEARPAAWRNRAVTDSVEPGSTVKVFLAAAAVDGRLVGAEERFYAERGVYHLGRRTVRDTHPAEWLTLPEILKMSSNIGAIKVAERVGAARYRAALGAFGFGRRTGVGLPGEVEGTLRPLGDWSRVSLATASYGYGLAATPMQIATAFAAIANGGAAVPPRVARGSLDGGRFVSLAGPRAGRARGGPDGGVRRVIAPETARRITSMLEAAVGTGGTGHAAALEGYRVAGKTGTARKVDEGGGYARDRYLASFVGFVPADAPRVVIAVFVDEPRTSIYGGVVAAPAFRAIAAAAMDLFRIAPQMPRAAASPAGPRRQAPRTPPPPAPRVVLAAAPAAVGPAAAEDLVPDFAALAVREALALARANGLDLDVAGSGWAVAQRPAAGTPRPRDGRVSVRFTP